MYYCNSIIAIPPLNDHERENFLKTWSEKEKMLVTRILSLSNNVLYPSQSEIECLNHMYFVIYNCLRFGLN